VRISRRLRQAIIDQLAQLGYTFRLNRCGSLIEVGGEPITDLLAAQIRTQLRDLGWKRFGAVEDAYTAHAVAHSYHPVRDYLEALRWDGQEHIAALATHLHSDDPPVVYPDGTRCSLVGVYLCRWLIGAVAKALDHQQNVMLVLAGPQNIGKSHLVRWLCPPALRAQHYIESPINPGDKDHLVRLMTKWIWEVGELDATTRKADVSALKDFITRGEVTVRRSYGRYDTTGPSMASFVGTVNNESGFLADPTGNRRFLVVGLTAIDWAYQQLDIDQIWAEAVARLRAGESWQLLPEEANHQAAQNRQYQTDSVLIDHLRKHLFFTSDSTDAMTAGDVVDMLRLKDVKLSGSDRAQAMEISAAMAALGVQKDRRNNVRYYIGIQPK
jgi:predicted P-loop ATPase